MPEHVLGDLTISIQIHVEDVDGLVERAVAAGAKLLRPIKDEFYGDRIAWMQDPFGHRWCFATRIEDVSPDEMKRLRAHRRLASRQELADSRVVRLPPRRSTCARPGETTRRH